MRSIYASYLTTPTWESKRRLTLARDHRRCTGCGASDEKLVVHHTKYPAILGSEHTSTLRTLCEPCHRDAHRAEPDLRPPTDSHVLASLRHSAVVFDLRNGSEHAFRYVDDIFRDGYWCLFIVPGHEQPVSIEDALRWSVEMRGNLDRTRIIAVRRLRQLASQVPIPAIADLFVADIAKAFPDVDFTEPTRAAPEPAQHDLTEPWIRRLLSYALADRDAKATLFRRLQEVWGDDVPELIRDYFSIGISEYEERRLRESDAYIACTEGRIHAATEASALLDVCKRQQERKAP